MLQNVVLPYSFNRAVFWRLNLRKFADGGTCFVAELDEIAIFLLCEVLVEVLLS